RSAPSANDGGRRPRTFPCIPLRRRPRVCPAPRTARRARLQPARSDDCARRPVRRHDRHRRVARPQPVRRPLGAPAHSSRESRLRHGGSHPRESARRCRLRRSRSEPAMRSGKRRRLLHAGADGRARSLRLAEARLRTAAERSRHGDMRRDDDAADLYDRGALDRAWPRRAHASPRHSSTGAMSKPRDLGLLPPPAQRASFRSRNVSGMTLIELMVALAIGSFLLLGAVTVFVQSQAAFRVNEASARLQENARFALGAIEPDIRMAYYLGLTTRPDRIRGRASPDDPVAFAVGGDCGPNWTVNLDAAIDGTNNVYGWSCTPYAGAGAMAGSDTLVVRRVEEAPGAPAPNRLQVQSARFQEGELFVGPDVPEGYSSETSATYRLVV